MKQSEIGLASIVPVDNAKAGSSKPRLSDKAKTNANNLKRDVNTTLTPHFSDTESVVRQGITPLTEDMILLHNTTSLSEMRDMVKESSKEKLVLRSNLSTGTQSSFLDTPVENEKQAEEVSRCTSKAEPEEPALKPIGIEPSDSFLQKLFGTEEAAEQVKAPTSTFVLDRMLVWHPDSRLRYSWDMVAISLVIYTLFVLPATLAFQWEAAEEQDNDETAAQEWNGWKVMDVIIDAFFMCDIVFNFVTGYHYFNHEHEDMVEMHLPRIAHHYARTWLILDIIASFPTDLLVTGSNSGLLRIPRILKILRLARLLRLLRLSRMLRYLKRFKIQDWLNITDFQIRIMKLVFCAVTFIHWNACLQWMVVVARDFPPSSWALLSSLEDASVFEQYSWSTFRALSHMLCIGYGQEPPYNLGEMWVVTISMVLGASLFAVFVGIVTTLLIQLDSTSAIFSQKMHMINQYMHHCRLPRDLRERIRDAYEYRWQAHKTFDEALLLQELPVSLRTEVAMYNCRGLLTSVPFFIDSEPGFVSTVVTLLRPHIFLAGDMVVRRGEVPREMFFIRLGEVRVMVNQGVVTFLCQGSYFGEISLVLHCHRTADVEAVQDCELYSLQDSAFKEVFHQYPAMAQAMTKIAQHRMDALERHTKMNPLRRGYNATFQQLDTLNKHIENFSMLERKQRHGSIVSNGSTGYRHRKKEKRNLFLRAPTLIPPIEMQDNPMWHDGEIVPSPVRRQVDMSLRKSKVKGLNVFKMRHSRRNSKALSDRVTRELTDQTLSPSPKTKRRRKMRLSFFV